MNNRLQDFVSYNIATVFGAGLSPVAPGTVGSLVAALLALVFWPESWVWQLAWILGATALGVWSAGWMEDALGEEDPSMVVIDEVAGQWLTFFLLGSLDWRMVLVGFLFFRVLDVVKPWPVSKLETLPGGVGIMADDLGAGLIACLLTHICFWVV